MQACGASVAASFKSVVFIVFSFFVVFLSLASSAESAREVLFTHLLHTLHCWPAGRFAHSAAALQQIAKIFRFSNVLLFCSEILPKPMSSIVDVDYVCVFFPSETVPFPAPTTEGAYFPIVLPTREFFHESIQTEDGAPFSSSTCFNFPSYFRTSVPYINGQRSSGKFVNYH